MPDLLQIERAHLSASGAGPWQAVSAEDFVRHCEGSGYMDTGTALLVLSELGQLEIPSARYRVRK